MALKINRTANTKRRFDFDIRPFVEQDLEQVVDLAKIHFTDIAEAESSHLKVKFRSDLSGDNQSIVCCSADGNIHGFLSVKMVDFKFTGNTIKGAIFSDFMVNATARAALIPMRMLQKALKGPQDFSFSEDAVQASRLLWCALGGQIAYPYSTYYSIPLRPATYSTTVISKNFSPWINNVFTASGRSVDKILGALRIPYFYSEGQDVVTTEKLTSRELCKGLSSLMKSHVLYPVIKDETINGFIESLKSEKQYGKYEGVAVYDGHDKNIGWFVYYLNDAGRCNIIHAECIPGKEEMLYASLKADAYSKGGVIISGRLSPNHIGSPFSEKTISRPGGKWALVHSKNSEILNTIQSGKAFLTRCW